MVPVALAGSCLDRLKLTASRFVRAQAFEQSLLFGGRQQIRMLVRESGRHSPWA
jgi:hypothetical protein